MKPRDRVVLWASCVALLAAPAYATELLPGQTVDLFGAAGFAPGFVIHDQVIPFEIRDGFGNILYEAALQNRVVRVNETDELAFIYRIRNSVGGWNGVLEELATVDFTEFSTDVEWMTDGLGVVGPDQARRSPDGAEVDFIFSNGLFSGVESRFMVIKTDATRFTEGGTTELVLMTGQSVVLSTVTPLPPDDTPPIAEITAPNPLTCVCNPQTVTGTAADPESGVESYTLEYSQHPAGPWTTIATGTSEVIGGTLGVWNTTGLTRGHYFLRLRVENGWGLASSFTTVVWIDGGFDNLTIRSPSDGAVVGRDVCVDGTGWDNYCFDYYTVDYRPAAGGPYQPVDPGQPVYTSTVINDPLAIWETYGGPPIPDGDYTIRAIGMTDCGASETVYVGVTVDNTAPTAVITSPLNCDEVEGLVDVIGTADDANLASWVLQYTGGDVNTWVTIASGNTPVVNDRLGTWDTRNLTPCPYTLRLRVTDQSVLNCNASSRNRTDYLTSVVLSGYCMGLGDMNCDGVVDAFDIDPFVLCLTTGECECPEP